MLSKYNLGAVLVLLALPLTGHAETLHVNCDQSAGRPATIGAALQHLKGLAANVGPNTIQVTGTCKENITVDGLENLTLTGVNGASITDASGGTQAVISVTKTRNFALNGFAIRGGGGPFNTAIACLSDSTCYFSNNDVQIPGGVGVVAALGVSVWFDNDVLENSAIGLSVIDASRAILIPATIRNNTSVGIAVGVHSFLETNFSAVVENNVGGGIFVVDHSSAQISATSITGNSGVGVYALDGSEVAFYPALSTISGNAFGVAVQDLSWANFNPSTATVSGSATQPDIQCWGHFSGATSAAAAGSTNCAP